MLSAFRLIDGNKLVRLELDDQDDLRSALWIDVVEPEEVDRQRVQDELGQSLATSPELDDIEASARFFEDEDGLHIHSFFYYEDADDRASNTTVAFTIHDGRLFTLRERDLPAFRLYRMRARYQSMVEGNAYELLLDLFETKIEQLADEIENIYSSLESLSGTIMAGRHPNEGFDEALSELSELEDRGWKVRLCLMDTQRALNFLVRKARLPSSLLEQAREVLRDIESLVPHNESIFQKVTFLMQAAMGFINIEQSRIIKIFSVVSVVFLPPTVVASSYGMNFTNMPELQWEYGYPAALALMVAAALAPYFYFKWKKWL